MLEEQSTRIARDAQGKDKAMIDAGETINLGIELQNKGGQAKDVTATIDVTRAGGVSDTYVSIVTPTVNYGPIGTYSILGNGLTRDANNNVTGVSNPFAIKIADNCPNDYLCGINVSLNWKNGSDSTDEAIYAKTETIQISVHHGILLPNIISANTTLKSGELYILGDNVVINFGVTLTIEPGATVQFYASTSSYYTGSVDIRGASAICLICNGNISAVGTLDKPISFKVSDLYGYNHATYFAITSGKGTGVFSYCNFQNAIVTKDIESTDWGDDQTPATFDHCTFFSTFTNGGNERVRASGTSVTNCSFDVVGLSYFSVIAKTIDNNVFLVSASSNDSDDGIFAVTSLKNNVFYMTNNDTGIHVIAQAGCDIDNNAFLVMPSVSSLAHWNTVVSFSPYSSSNTVYLKNTFWSGTPTTLIPSLITDYKNNGTKSLIDYSSYNNSIDFPSFWPFVKNVHMEDDAGNTLTTVSTNKVKVVVDFNRDMDTTMDLDVAFGSVEPYNDYTISGSFASKTQWVGTYTFKTLIENGQQYWRISNGRADADHFKTLMTDKQRFGFIIDTTAAQSMALNAVSDASGVTLTWAQDDYTTLAGYNVYRSDTKEGTCKKLNAVLIPYDVVTYKDTTARPGKTYFYYFTVVMTDFTESHPSGATSVTTLDTEAPSLYHTAITEAYLGSNLVITATIADNVGITGATLYYRVKGSTTWLSTSMTHLNSAYSGIIDASYLTSAGLEYYISATDGINVVTSGSADAPHSVSCKSAVTENQKGDVDGDGMITVKDALMVLKSINGDLTLTADQKTRGDVDNDGTLTAADALAILQYANGTITKF